MLGDADDLILRDPAELPAMPGEELCRPAPAAGHEVPVMERSDRAGDVEVGKPEEMAGLVQERTGRVAALGEPGIERNP
jgi:hypothetical protein